MSSTQQYRRRFKAFQICFLLTNLRINKTHFCFFSHRRVNIRWNKLRKIPLALKHFISWRKRKANQSNLSNTFTWLPKFFSFHNRPVAAEFLICWSICWPKAFGKNWILDATDQISKVSIGSTWATAEFQLWPEKWRKARKQISKRIKWQSFRSVTIFSVYLYLSVSSIVSTFDG